MNFLNTLWVTWFGLGKSPAAPGTMGSVGTLPMIFLIAYNIPTWPTWQFGPCVINAFLPMSLAIFFISLLPVKRAIAQSRCEDPQFVVIDEVAGQTLAFAFINPAHLTHSYWVLALGLVLFRIFDITKILGIHKLESLHGAWGVMADDMLGGLYAGLILAGLVTLFG